MDTITVTSTTEAALLGVVLFLVVTTMLLTTSAPKMRGTWPAFALLAALFAAIILHAGAAIATQLWIALTITPAAAVSALFALDTHLAASRERTSLLEYLIWRRINKQISLPPMKPLDVLRAEYAQPVLDDAVQDPNLDEAVENEVRNIIEGLHLQFHRPATASDVVAFANGWLTKVTDPDRKPMQRVHPNHSTELVVLAAACRTADRL